MVKALGEDFTYQGLILRMDCHPLIKMAHVFNKICLAIIYGKSGLIEATTELGLLNTPRKR